MKLNDISSDEILLHAVLYMKGHYVQSDTNLKLLVGRYYGVDHEYVSDEHIMHFHIQLIKRYLPHISFEHIVMDAFKEVGWKADPQARKSITRIDIADAAAVHIRHGTVDQFPGLPENADPDILPLSSFYKKGD